MTLWDRITAYQPGDETEAADKASFLQFLAAFGDKVYQRENLVGHVTATAWIANKAHDKVLMCFHNIYQAWALPGGHADGNSNLVQVVLKEVSEETGLTNLKINEELMNLSVLCVKRHLKKGKIVPAHLHYDVQYLVEADESERVTVAPEENSGLRWVNVEDVIVFSGEEHLIPTYQRIIKKLRGM